MHRKQSIAVSLLLSLWFLLLSAMPAQAAAGPRIFLDRNEVSFDVPPVIAEGRTLVPIRALATALGFSVGWDPDARQVTLTRETTVIKLWLDSTRVEVNGEPGTIDVPATVISDRLFVPVRFIAERLGTYVGWEAALGGVLITTPRGMIAKAAGAGPLPDQELAGQLSIHVTESGEAVVNQRQAFSLRVPFQMQSLRGELDATWVPFTYPPTNREVTIKGGKLYTQGAAADEWIPGPAPASPSLGSLTGLPLLDLPGLSPESLARARVEMLPAIRLGGRELARVRVDLTPADPQPLYQQVVDTLPVPKGQERQVQISTGHYLIDYSIEPATGFIYRAHREVGVTAAGTRGGKPYSLTMDTATDWNAVPNLDPVRFPVPLVAVPHSFASAAEKQAALDYYGWLEEQASSFDLCYGMRVDGREIWAKRAYGELNPAPAETADCFASQLGAIDTRTPPPLFTEVHGHIRQAIADYARAYRALAEAIRLDQQGNRQAGEAGVDEFERLSQEALRETNLGVYQLLVVEAEYILPNR